MPEAAGELRRRTTQELVRDYLRNGILTGEIPGGARLVQADVAERLRVSTTPVREALRDLITEGLIEFDPHRGAVVHVPSLEELLELYTVREVVEPLALRFSFKRGPTGLVQAASAVQDQLDATTDPATWAELNWQFHNVLIQGANPRLRSIVKVLQDASVLYVAHDVTHDAERITSGNAEHHLILEALRAGNVDAAANHLKAHMAATLSGILTHDSTIPDRPEVAPG